MDRSLPPGLLPAALLLACTACAEDLDRARWSLLLSGQADDPVAEAAALARAMTPELAAEVEARLGAFDGSVRLNLLAGIAQARRDGVRTLAAKLYGRPLEQAFPLAFGLIPREEDEDVALFDDADVADALADVLPDDPVAWLWLAAAADTPDSEVGARTRERMASDDAVRRHVRLGLDSPSLRRVTCPELLEALGTPDDIVEAEWLEARYRDALEDAVTGLPAGENSAATAILAAWSRAFDDADPPLPEEDLAIVRVLADEEDDSTLPPFDEVASFLERRRRTDWPSVMRTWKAEGLLTPDALARVCRVSSAECGEALREELFAGMPAAADVAPALDLEQGDELLATACDVLPEGEAIALARRGAGAAMDPAVRESAADCLALHSVEEPGLVREVLASAASQGRWEIAVRMSETFADAPEWLVGEAARQAAAGRVDPMQVAALLVQSEDGRAVLRDALAARGAFLDDPEEEADAAQALLSAVGRSLQRGRMMHRVIKLDNEPGGCIVILE